MMLSGWGRYPKQACRVNRPRTQAELSQLIAQGSLIARGNGRAYGDSALNTHNTIDMRSFNHMLAFDTQTGQLIVEAGVLLEDVINCFLSQGWFPPVTPGTKFVTIGGMVAADVHGKNHHTSGSFGNFIDWLDVLDNAGKVHRCSREQNSELFHWTIGGMGLTGVILHVAFRLLAVESAWIRQTTQAATNLQAVMDAFEQTLDTTYSVAWVDCLSSGDQLGRSLLMLGEHARLDELPAGQRTHPYQIPGKRKLSVPCNAPSFALNKFSVRAFNKLYYYKGKQQLGATLIDWDSYFYPLDGLLNWNRIYGGNGFAQFQCVLPLECALSGLQSLLKTTAKAGQGSFLAVLKRFGEQQGRFSFPMAGYTLALDFPINQHSLTLLNELDDIVLAHQGRFYLAKDSRMHAEVLRQSDKRVADFIQMRQTQQFNNHFNSSQSNRLQL